MRPIPPTSVSCQFSNREREEKKEQIVWRVEHATNKQSMFPIAPSVQPSDWEVQFRNYTLSFFDHLKSILNGCNKISKQASWAVCPKGKLITNAVNCWHLTNKHSNMEQTSSVAVSTFVQMWMGFVGGFNVEWRLTSLVLKSFRHAAWFNKHTLQMFFLFFLISSDEYQYHSNE